MPLLAILLISGTGCFIVWAFTPLRNCRNEVRTTWNDVEAALGERTGLVTRLVDIVAPRLRDDVAEQLTKAHQRMGTVIGPRGAEAADTALRSLLDPILATMPSSMGLDSLKAELAAANKAVDAAGAEYNAKVDAYEAVRTSGPRQVFADLLGFEKESRFGRLRAGDPLLGDTLLDPTLLAGLPQMVPSAAAHPTAAAATPTAATATPAGSTAIGSVAGQLADAATV